MNHIISATDLSDNSKSGMRFAVQLAAAQGAELVFLHIHHVPRAIFWSEKEYQEQILMRRENLLKALASFAKQVCMPARMPGLRYRIAVHHHEDPVAGILEYAENGEDTSCICVSTRGAGMIRKLYGTHTARLILSSRFPVVCIPSDYRIKPMQKILYASDMTDQRTELAQVIAFARPLEVPVEVVHLHQADFPPADPDKISAQLQSEVNYPVTVRFRRRMPGESLPEAISAAATKAKASLLVLFSHTRRPLWDEILRPANAGNLSFRPVIPFVSFNKEVTAHSAGKNVRHIAAGS